MRRRATARIQKNGLKADPPCPLRPPGIRSGARQWASRSSRRTKKCWREPEGGRTLGQEHPAGRRGQPEGGSLGLDPVTHSIPEPGRGPARSGPPARALLRDACGSLPPRRGARAGGGRSALSVGGASAARRERAQRRCIVERPRLHTPSHHPSPPTPLPTLAPMIHERSSRGARGEVCAKGASPMRGRVTPGASVGRGEKCARKEPLP